MINNKNTVYQRILLKLSGEALQGKESFGIDTSFLDLLAQEIKELIALGVQVAIVIGGGNLFRGAGLSRSGMNRVVGDHIGMLATVMNGLALRDSLHRAYINACLMSAIPLSGVCENYNWSKAIDLLGKNHIVILSAGIGNPFFTTDSAACLRGIEIEANVVLKATKVDGVYSSDPAHNEDAILYEQLTYSQVLNQELKIMDLTAFTLARAHNLPIHVFNINKRGALRCIVVGQKEGTIIKN
ncbi:UMP kinase [Candidatus Pantoea edessiphila]|uniref:Uridylate kinase n=1 Tax=Candidatus Pantoea edessiphila TaxID=2044610 RepID=A0A2P5SY41_9GAMM|nr:UMP kinase [Candidatus Pantoea edessiphila]MBK4775567.1 UMP kinase [Pantoea sp. Edef]PPI87220.1 UMP kinase [Candidatus Pantoea edessiphila]